MQTCPDCNSRIPDGVVFCDNCGYQIRPELITSGGINPAGIGISNRPASAARYDAPAPPPGVHSSSGGATNTCSVCGYVNIPGEMFCGNCGVQLAPVASVPPPPPVRAGTGEASPVVKPSQPNPTPGNVSNIRPVDPNAPTIPGPAGCHVCGYINRPGEAYCGNCGVELAPLAPTQEASLPPPLLPVEQPVPSVETAQAAAPPKPISQPVPVIPTVVPAPISKPSPIPKECPTCGYNNPGGEAYCLNCGFWLVTETPLPQVQQAVIPPVETAAGKSPTTADLATMVMAPLAPPVIDVGKLVAVTTKVEFPLPAKSEILLGRRDPDRAVFPEIDLGAQGTTSASVSRQHARLLVEAGQIFLEDLNSTNSTYLNRQRVQPGQRVLVKNGDEIRLGGLALIYHAPGQ